MAPAKFDHHCPGRNRPGKSCKLRNGGCTVHQTPCYIHGFWHANWEECPECEKGELSRKRADRVNATRDNGIPATQRNKIFRILEKLSMRIFAKLQAKDDAESYARLVEERYARRVEEQENRKGKNAEDSTIREGIE